MRRTHDKEVVTDRVINADDLQPSGVGRSSSLAMKYRFGCELPLFVAQTTRLNVIVSLVSGPFCVGLVVINRKFRIISVDKPRGKCVTYGFRSSDHLSLGLNVWPASINYLILLLCVIADASTKTKIYCLAFV